MLKLPPRKVIPTAIVAVLALAGTAVFDHATAADRSERPIVGRADGTWTRLAPVPEARTEVSVTTDGRLIYLIGGFKEAPAPDPKAKPGERAGQARERAFAPRTMLVYDPEQDRWSDAGEIPEGVNHAGFVAVDNRLFIVGGYRENTFEPTGAVRIYDIQTQTWTDGAPMPTPRGALAYTVLDGKIHTIGGTVAPPEPLAQHQHGARQDYSVGVHEVYDPATNTWEQRAPMPTPRNHHAAVAINGKICVTAGRLSTNFTMTQTEVYDPAADRWQGAAPLPTGRSGVAAVALNGWMYLFGGETFDPEARRTFNDAERYNPAEDRWEVLPPMPTARHGLGAAVVGDAIYVISGGPEPGFSFGTANERLTVELAGPRRTQR